MTLREATSPREAQKQVGEYLDELRTRLLEGAVIPFLGAGISYACKSPKETPILDPTTKSLQKSLARWLWVQCKCSPDTAKRAGKLLDVPDLHCSKEEEAFVNCCERASLAKLAEVCTWLSDSRTVCEELDIQRFTVLVPRPAHRYIAYLVREGLIDQVVTTNWDTCVEEALKCSFGPRLATRLDGAGAGEGSSFHVISQIEEYRRWGAYRRRGGGRRQPVLRLYKINGCAAAYKRDPAAEAERIALTERQLQGFRDNHWAADLFRDRARSHRLLFSGFGSEEPQIRHAVTVLAAEFGAGPRPAYGHAPFVQVYDESPTFNQYQLLRAYYRKEESDLRVGLKQVVTGIHADRFPDPSLPGCQAGSGRAPRHELDADRFWFGVYLAAMRGLVQRYCEPPSPFYAWLAQRQCSSGPAREVMRLKRWLYPDPRRTRSASASPPPYEFIFGRFITLFRPVESTTLQWPYPELGPGPMRLWAWLSAIQGRPDVSVRFGSPSDYYLPMRDGALLALSTLYLLMRLVPDLSDAELNAPPAEHSEGRRDPPPRVRTQPSGLRVRVRAGTAEEPPFDVWIVHHGASTPSPPLSDNGAMSRMAISYQLAVSNRLVEAAARSVRIGRWERGLTAPNHAVATLRPGRFVQLPAQRVDFTRAAQENCLEEPENVRRAREDHRPRTRSQAMCRDELEK